MIRFEIFSNEMTMTTKDFAETMLKLCQQVTAEGKDWKEFMNQNIRIIEAE